MTVLMMHNEPMFLRAIILMGASADLSRPVLSGLLHSHHGHPRPLALGGRLVVALASVRRCAGV